MSEPLPPRSGPAWRAWLASRVPSPSPLSPRLAAGVAVGALLAVALLVGWLVLGSRQPVPELVLPRAVPDPPAAGGTTGSAERAPGPGGAVPPATVVVHAAGAVADPGIYALAASARVADALAAAGGPRADADLDLLNLATKLADGDRIYVPRRGEVPPAWARPGISSGERPAEGLPGQPTSALPVVDLNTATTEDLDRLPGIGPATARAIVDHRERNGPFRSVSALLEVRGIGPAKLEALRPRVRV